MNAKTSTLAFKRFKAASLGDTDYPNAASFIDAESDFVSTAILHAVEDQRPFVLIYEDGHEVIYLPQKEYVAESH